MQFLLARTNFTRLGLRVSGCWCRLPLTDGKFQSTGMIPLSRIYYLYMYHVSSVYFRKKPPTFCKWTNLSGMGG